MRTDYILIWRDDDVMAEWRWQAVRKEANVTRRLIEIREGETAMNGYYHPDIELELGKAKIREFYQECERVTLAREAQNFQPGRLRSALNQVASLFKRLSLKLDKRSGSARPRHEGYRSPRSTRI